MTGRQVGDATDWNQTTVLWCSRQRVTARVVMVIAMDTTALLLIWAFLELVCKQERRREGVLFILKICYISSVTVTVIFINIALYLHPMHPSCGVVVGLGYVSGLCSLSWGLLMSLQRFLTSRNVSPEQLRSQGLALSLTIFYLITGYGIPCTGLITLMTYFDSRQIVAKTMCWLSSETMWWMIMPVIFYVGGTYTVALLTLRQYRNTQTDIRCFVYTCFLLNVLLASSLLMIQVDITWPSLGKGYFFLLIIVIHNVLVWFHLTEAFAEVCPCAYSADDVVGSMLGAMLFKLQHAHHFDTPFVIV